MGTSCSAPAAGKANVVSVIRSPAWGFGDEGDTWQVEVTPDATVADLKAKIEELYELPREEQKLAGRDDPEADAFEDALPLSSLSGQRLHLLPAGPSAEEEEVIAGVLGDAQHRMEMSMALEQSLQGVTYLVNFERPADSGGSAAGKTISLALDALALVGDVQQMVEVELFGAAGAEPAFLVFEGVPLPPHVPIHFAGIETGKTVTVVKEQPPVGTMEDGVLVGSPGMGGPAAMAA
mmetsp:Transcript_79272/g.183963  ORF Transcript_79272/g.183963 Transcript_79272/m.183963 type:complete len:236 (+) Transcript_79272:45-752(+)